MLDPPTPLAKIRVAILRETFQGANRDYADVKAIRILDEGGIDLLGGRRQNIPLKIEDPAVSQILGNVSFPPEAVRVERTGAQVVATLQDKPRSPAILKNVFGTGEAWLVTTGDGSTEGNNTLWAGLASLAAKGPTLSVSPEDMDRYRIILTNVAGGHALHLIDKSVSRQKEYVPKDVTISLAASRLGNPSQAQAVGSDGPVTMTRQADQITLTVKPDPVASVMLK